jgi:phosphatidate cytidylyltransferase
MMPKIYLVCLAAFLAGGMGLYWATRKAPASIRMERKTKFIVYFLIVHTVLVSAWLGRFALAVLFALVVLAGAHELYRVLKTGRKLPSVSDVLIGVGYLLLAALLLRFVWRAEPREVLFVYLVVAAFDGFSQVLGQLAGTHLLVSRISPGKTVEGTVGGLLFAAGIGLGTQPLVDLQASRTLALCAGIAVAGLAGDLLGSLIKRRSNVKDFGSILPGHGGFLDRFDSFFVAGPVSWILLHRL